MQAPAHDGVHFQGAEIRIVDADNIIIEFVFQGGGPRAVETIKLHRVQR